MRTLQISDETHHELMDRKRSTGAKNVDVVIHELLHHTPQKLQIITAIQRLAPALKFLGATRVRLFGSVQRDDAKPGSDVDLIVDLAPGKTYYDLGRIQDLLTECFHAHADVVLPGGLHPRLANAILAEAEEIEIA